MGEGKALTPGKTTLRGADRRSYGNPGRTEEVMCSKINKIKININH